MNLNYESNNYLVKYLQTFLQENYSTSINVSGRYDSETHEYLLNYLRLPNTSNIEIINTALKADFVELFDRFILYRSSSDLVFVSKVYDTDTIRYIDDIRYELSDYVNKYGYVISELSNSNNSDTTKLRIVIKGKDKKDLFPNKDMLCLVNSFNNRYIYNMAIVDNIGQDDILHESAGYKVGVIPCEPNTTYGICHGYDHTTPIVVSSSMHSLKEISLGDISVDNTVSVNLGVSTFLNYTTSDTCKHLLIQMPHTSNIIDKTTTVKVPVLVGDVNLDNVVNKTDRDLLKGFIDSNTVLKGMQFVAANTDTSHKTNGQQVIDNWDLAKLDDYLEGVVGNLGVVYYDQLINDGTSDYNKLLVIQGDYSNLNVPAEEFITDPWSVHGKFLNYLMDIGITGYSNQDDIYYAQKLIGKLYTSYSYNPGLFDSEMRTYIKEFQDSRDINFSFGYLDVETEAEILKILSDKGGISV